MQCSVWRLGCSVLATPVQQQAGRRASLLLTARRLQQHRAARSMTVEASAAAGQASGAPGIKHPLLSVAPMMDYTDVYCRQLERLLSRHTVLWTEMVVDKTIIHTENLDKHLWFPPEQRPIVCQVGGSDPVLLAQAAKVVESYGYDEINLNCGCPSDRVAGAGCFGAALMLQPELVADCCRAMGEAVSIPVSVKCRIGVDDRDSYEQLCNFIRAVSERSPVRHFIIHARKCLLKGLNPHQNRTIPPLRYEWVWALKRDFPHLQFTLNGGVLSLEEAAAALGLPGGGGDLPPRQQNQQQQQQQHLLQQQRLQQRGHQQQDAGSDSSCSSGKDEAEAGPLLPEGGVIAGVMVGRAAYHQPWDLLAGADVSIFGAEANPAKSRRQVLEEYARWADGMIGRWRSDEEGWRVPNVRTLTKPIMGMFYNEPRAKKWRAAVDTALKTATSVRQVLDMTLHVLKPESLDDPPRPLASLPPRLLHYTAVLPEPVPASQGQLQEELAELGPTAAGDGAAAQRPAQLEQVAA